MTDVYERGAVVKDPDLLADHDDRPYVCLTDSTHPFHDKEALYVAATAMQRTVAIPLTDDDFASDGLPRKSYANLWTVVTIRHADIVHKEGHLVEATTENRYRSGWISRCPLRALFPRSQRPYHPPILIQ